jgi:hypothetical protein
MLIGDEHAHHGEAGCLQQLTVLGFGAFSPTDHHEHADVEQRGFRSFRSAGTMRSARTASAKYS